MRLLIAGGGTGGHLFPALAVARAVTELDAHAEVGFVGTRRGIEARVIPETEFPIDFISVGGIRGKGIVESLKGAFAIPRAIVQSFGIIRRFRPDVVLGVGGYASGPTLLAGRLSGVPTAIQEQNSVMGTTNRILSRLVDRIFISWEDTEPRTPEEKTVLAGNPVRRDVLEPSEIDKSSDTFHILVFGGSQGARSINEAMMKNADRLASMGDRISLFHQTGRDAADAVAEAYKKVGLNAKVQPFIDDMRSAYAWADLVISRSGASTMAELTSLGKPAIVVPYPYAIGDHQAKNASVPAARGAVRVVPDHKVANGALIHEIERLLENPDALRTMAEQSRKMGRPDAARTIAEHLVGLARKRA